MGPKNIIWMILLYLWLSSWLSLIPRTTFAMKSSHDPYSLDEFIHDYALNVVKYPSTGMLYNVSLPSNYSHIGVSFLRIRTGSLWIRGRNSTFFEFPPRIIPLPFVKRLDIVFQNLGNLSTYYYHIPNYTFVTPVIGFNTYSGDTNLSSSSNGTQRVTLSLRGDPIFVRFPNISVINEGNISAGMKCVRFGLNKTAIEFSNVTLPNVCTARDQGHFSIVVPSLPPTPSHSPLPPPTSGKNNEKLWKWWGIGVGGLMLLVLCGMLACKMFGAKRIESMEKQSQKNVALDTVWVGRSKMPSAGGIRTQPVLENDDLP